MTIAALRDLSASDIAAWWGAGIATLVLGWEVFKWRKDRAAIRVVAKANMQLAGPGGLAEEKHILVTVSNVGGQTTTITHLVVAHYSTMFRRLLRKPNMQGAIPDPRPGRLPHALGPGQIWTGLVDQADVSSKHDSGGYLYFGVCHSLSTKPVMSSLKV